MRRFRAAIVVGVCGPFLIVTLYFIGQIMIEGRRHGCADVHSTPMGTVMEGPTGKNRLQWDDQCPSGVAWVAK